MDLLPRCSLVAFAGPATTNQSQVELVHTWSRSMVKGIGGNGGACESSFVLHCPGTEGALVPPPVALDRTLSGLGVREFDARLLKSRREVDLKFVVS